MRVVQNQSVDEDVIDLTIPEAEELIEEALEELSFSTDPGLAQALKFLTPPGYSAIVELCGENGRSKRRNAPSSSWSPEEDEIRIYFERTEDSIDAAAEIEPGNARFPKASPVRVRQSRAVTPIAHGNHAGNSAGPGIYDDGMDEETGNGLPPDIDDRIKELCATLAEAERGGHAFIALKWFRDSFLPRKAFSWNQHPESRQMILAEAIQRGVVLTSKIPNPKTPAYPTTTIRLNRAEAGMPEEAQRFRPVPMQGDAFNSTLDDDRGNM